MEEPTSLAQFTRRSMKLQKTRREVKRQERGSLILSEAQTKDSKRTGIPTLFRAPCFCRQPADPARSWRTRRRYGRQPDGDVFAVAGWQPDGTLLWVMVNGDCDPAAWHCFSGLRSNYGSPTAL